MKFHGEDHNIWTYCVYLGPYTEEGREFDLGVYDNNRGSISLAAVYGKNEWQYKSGEMIFNEKPTDLIRLPMYREAYKRYLDHLGKQRAEAKRGLDLSERICLSCSHRHYRTDIHGLLHGYKEPASACEKCGGETEYTNRDADLTGDAREASINDAFDFMESGKET